MFNAALTGQTQQLRSCFEGFSAAVTAQAMAVWQQDGVCAYRGNPFPPPPPGLMYLNQAGPSVHRWRGLQVMTHANTNLHNGAKALPLACRSSALQMTTCSNPSRPA